MMLDGEINAIIENNITNKPYISNNQSRNFNATGSKFILNNTTAISPIGNGSNTKDIDGKTKVTTRNYSSSDIDFETELKVPDFENRKIFGITKAFLKNLIYNYSRKLATINDNNVTLPQSTLSNIKDSNNSSKYNSVVKSSDDSNNSNSISKNVRIYDYNQIHGISNDDLKHSNISNSNIDRNNKNLNNIFENNFKSIPKYDDYKNENNISQSSQNTQSSNSYYSNNIDQQYQYNTNTNINDDNILKYENDNSSVIIIFSDNNDITNYNNTRYDLTTPNNIRKNISNKGKKIAIINNNYIKKTLLKNSENKISSRIGYSSTSPKSIEFYSKTQNHNGTIIPVRNSNSLREDTNNNNELEISSMNSFTNNKTTTLAPSFSSTQITSTINSIIIPSNNNEDDDNNYHINKISFFTTTPTSNDNNNNSNSNSSTNSSSSKKKSSKNLPLDNKVNNLYENMKEHRSEAGGSDKAPKTDKDYLLVTKRIDSLVQNYFKKSKVDRFFPYLLQDGRFSDLNYSSSGESEDLREHARRLGALTQREIETRGNISTKVQNSFSFLTYEVPKITSTNWWLHVIGVPSNMWRTIFVARNFINETVKTDFIQRYFIKTKFGKVWCPEDISANLAGGNLGPRMLMGAVEHSLRGTLDQFLEQLKEILYNEIVLREPFQGNGLRQDGCLHQHNQILKQKTKDGKYVEIILSQMYNNNYGKELLKNAAAVMWFFDSTKFDLGDEIEEGIFASFLECQQWLYRARTVEPSSVGRFIDAGTIVTRIGGLDAVKRTLNFLQRVDRHRSEVVAALHRYYNVRPEKEFALIGNRHFFVSDLMAHQRQDYMASLRLLSSRTARPETIPPSELTGSYFNGNSKGYFKGDGFLTILVNGNELGSFEKEVFQVYDWARVPGVTCQYTKFVPEVSTTTSKKRHTYNEADFVGGVSNGQEGVAVMDYARPTVHLKAKKSWFFFDDVIVCLGSGISIPQHYVNGQIVTTTLNQVIYEGLHTVGFKHYEYVEHFNKSFTGRRLTTYGLSVNIWVHHGSIGYVSLLHDKGLGLEIDKRPLDLAKDSFINVFSLWLDHGVRPENATYAYALLPGGNYTHTRNFANNPTVDILTVNNFLHSVCLNSEKILGLVFLEKGCSKTDVCLKTTDIEEVCTDEPVLMLLKFISNHNTTNEACPRGVEILPINLKSQHIPNEISDHQNSVLNYGSTSSGSKTFNIRNINPDPEYTNSTEKSLDVLQLSVSDPTQKLKYFTLKVKSFKISHFMHVSLPPPPRAGSSLKLCLIIN